MKQNLTFRHEGSRTNTFLLPLRRSNFLMTAANFPCRRGLTLFTEDST
jgi:hypothetical protein